MAVRRNDPCPCGSGRKFKQCCSGKGLLEQRSWGGLIAVALGVIFTVGLALAVMDLFSEDTTAASKRRVWSEEHKHWHTVDVNTPGEPPPGPSPPGKVWSKEHGHWHAAQ
jgi:hypothetical protein